MVVNKGYSMQYKPMNRFEASVIPAMLDFTPYKCILTVNHLPSFQQMHLAHAAQLLWQTCFSNFNAGGLRLDSMLLPAGGSTLPYLSPARQLRKRGLATPAARQHNKQERPKHAQHQERNMMHQQMEMHKSNQEIAEAAMCNDQNVKYYTDPHRPTRLKGSMNQS
ncbi:TPA: hypothetical protein ACH3X2_007715 [Trebouxia sp. C0005]